MAVDWDDLRYVLAVAETDSLSAAARRLGVNHSTVFRRIRTVEARLGDRLFDRLPTGYAPTVVGEDVRTSALRVADEVAALDRRLSGRDVRLTGTIRATVSDDIAYRYIGRHVAGFHDAFPGIMLELAVDNRLYNISKREADVAVRPTHDPPENLVGRRVSDVAFALYGARDLFPANAGIDVLRALPWVVPDDSLAHIPQARWQRTRAPDADAAFRSNSMLGLYQGVTAGIGVGFLLCFLGDSDSALVRIRPPEPELTTGLWLLIHEDLRRSGRVRAFLDFMAAAIATDRDLLEGRSAAP